MKETILTSYFNLFISQVASFPWTPADCKKKHANRYSHAKHVLLVAFKKMLSHCLNLTLNIANYPGIYIFLIL